MCYDSENQFYSNNYDEYDDLPDLESVPESEPIIINPAEEEDEEIDNDVLERQREMDEYYEQYITEYQYEDRDLYIRESILQPRQVQSEHLSEMLYRNILAQIIATIDDN